MSTRDWISIGYIPSIQGGGVYRVYTQSIGSIANLYHIETVTQFCVNYSGQHYSGTTCKFCIIGVHDLYTPLFIQ